MVVYTTQKKIPTFVVFYIKLFVLTVIHGYAHKLLTLETLFLIWIYFFECNEIKYQMPKW